MPSLTIPVPAANDFAPVTDAPDVPTPPPLPPAPAATVLADSWQALPARGAWLYALGTGLGFAIPGAIVLATLSQAVLDWPWFLLALAGALAGLLLGGTLGLRRHRRIGWRLDQDGCATRRGGLWRNETLVPVSRVQHLDLERGPLERQLGLATLVVHTAGTRMAAVKLPLLALEDAQALRALLARQVETDDAL